MDEQLYLHIGQRLRERRRALRLSQSDLGAMTQIRFRQIAKYECGENRTSASSLWKFACALNVSVEYFFDGLAGRASTVAAEIAANDAANVAILGAGRAPGRGKRYQTSIG